LIVKPRCISDELKLMRILNARMELEEKDKQNYLNLEKGLEGELKFDALMENLTHERLILNDLLLERNTTKFQIDSLHIAQGTVYHFEVKNYEGDYYIEKDRFYRYSGKEILNPLHQVERSHILLQQLLQNLGNPFQLESYLIFINPSFTLYNAPKDPSIIFPTQLERFLWKMNRIPSSNLSTRHTKLAEQLLGLHQVDDGYNRRVPGYRYENLKKGSTCSSCTSFNLLVGKHKLVCNDCGMQEDINKAVIRIILEYNLLFPNIKISTKSISEWCIEIPQKTIRRVLAKNFKQVGNNRWIYYDI